MRYFPRRFQYISCESRGVQETLPQNMASWHIKNFKSKRFLKYQKQEVHSDILQHVFPEQVTKPSGEPSRSAKAASILVTKGKEHREELREGGLLGAPRSLWPLVLPHDFPLFIRPSTQILMSNCFFRSPFPVNAPTSCKTYVK